MKLSSPEFKNGYAIPSEYTCDGKNIPPELIIEDIPENTKTLALIMDDPDAPSGTFVHWLVWNIPKETKGIKKGEKIFYPQGKNDFQKNSYGGPCPPSGMHRYFFKLFALDASLDIIESRFRRSYARAYNFTGAFGWDLSKSNSKSLNIKNTFQKAIVKIY